MTIVPSIITKVDIFLDEEGNSAIQLTNESKQTARILIPLYLTSVLLVLVKAHMNCENPRLCVTKCLRTAKQLQQSPDVYLKSSRDVGSYIYKLRNMVINACYSNGISVGSEDLIVSKNGWGYGVHPDIQVTLHNQ